MEYIKSNKSKEYQFELEEGKKLKEQKLLESTKDLICFVYMEFLCNQIEKEKLDFFLDKNEDIYLKKLKEKYNIENIFKERRQSMKNEHDESITIQDNMFPKK